MALRQINTDLAIPDLQEFDSCRWSSIDCELVTPIHGGGTDARSSDTAMPIRATAIRGQLRTFWRMLYAGTYTGKTLRQKEFALWGGMNDDGENGKAGLVLLKVKADAKKFQEVEWKNYAHNINDPLGYALFTAKKTQTGLPDMKLGKEGFKWSLYWCFDNKISEAQKAEVIETLRWWATLGAIGGRSSRGCGAFKVIHAPFPYPITLQEMQQKNCHILYMGENKTNAMHSWINAVDTWKKMRKTNKEHLSKLIDSSDTGTRHLSSVVSRPVFNGSSWQAMIVMLPDSSQEIQTILKEQS